MTLGDTWAALRARKDSRYTLHLQKRYDLTQLAFEDGGGGDTSLRVCSFYELLANLARGNLKGCRVDSRDA